jgi:hypothetical protein
VDSFDPKPRLKAEHGKPFGMKIEATQFDNIGKVLASPWEFQPYGQSGLPVSALFPRIGALADDLCVIRSMKSDFPEHAQATLMLHCGHPLQGRPSLGSWLSYGLGSANANLPGYAVVSGGMIPLGGVENFSAGFLPATHQGSMFDAFSGGEPIGNVTPAEEPARQRAKLDFVAQADRGFLGALGGLVHGATDDYGYHAVADIVSIHDLHATVLHLMGIDHERLTFRHGGRDYRLTDVHGTVLSKLLA